MPDNISNIRSIANTLPSQAAAVGEAALACVMPNAVRRLFADRRGAAAVEFALVLPVLVFLMVGMFDYGALAFQNMEVSAAAHAGADYAIHNGWNSTAIQTAVTGATTLSVTASPAPQLSNGCLSGNTVVFQTGTTCSSGSTAGSYVIVNAQTPFTPLIAWSALTFPTTLSAQAVVRIQ